MKQPVSIVYLINELDVGGAERALYQLAVGIDRTTFLPRVVALHGRGEVGNWLKQKGVAVSYLELSSGYDLRALTHLRRLLVQSRAQILHSFLFEANFIGRIAARTAGVPVVVSSLRVAEKRKRDLWLDRLTIRLVDVETCVSEAVRKYAIERAGIPPAKLVTIHNGIDFSRFIGDRKAARTKLELSEDAPVVLSVGRLHEQKGFAYLVHAAKHVVRKFPSLQLLIAGIGPLEKELRQLIQQLELEKNVHLLGFRDDIPDLVQAADLFVLPSLWEGLANVILEALAAGKPVVATDVEGTSEVIRDGHSGILVPPANSQALADATITVLSNQRLAKLMGKRGQQLVKQNFTLARMVQQHEKLYLDLLRFKRRLS